MLSIVGALNQCFKFHFQPQFSVLLRHFQICPQIVRKLKILYQETENF